MALLFAMQFAVAKKESGVVIILSPFFQPRALPRMYKAAVPLFTTEQKFPPNLLFASIPPTLAAANITASGFIFEKYCP